MKRIKKQLLFFILRYPLFLLAGLILSLGFFGFWALRLHIDTSSDSLLLDNDKDFALYERIHEHFPEQDLLILAYSPNQEIFDQKTFTTLQELQTKLQAIPQIQSTYSILNAPLLKSTPNLTLEQILKQNPTIQSTQINLDLAKKELLEHPYYTQNLISKDGKTLAILIYLKPDEFQTKLEALKQKNPTKQELQSFILQHKQAQEQQNAQTINAIKAIKAPYQNQLSLGGITLITHDLVAYIKSDMLIYGSLLSLILGLMLWLFFHQWRYVILPLFACASTLILSSGTIAILGYHITVISSNYISLLLIITLSLIIHLSISYLEYHNKYPNTSQRHLVYATLLSKANPSFFAILTTIIGFLSLVFSTIEPIIKLGLIMSIGVSIALVVGYIVFGSVMVLLPKAKTIFSLPSWHQNILLGCASIAIKHKKAIYALCVIGFGISIYGLTQIKVENSFVNYFKNSSEIKQGLLKIDQHLGGTIPLEIVVQFPKQSQIAQSNSDFEAEFNSLKEQEHYWFDSQKLRIAKTIHQYLAKQPYLGSILSLHSLSSLISLLDLEQNDFVFAFVYQHLSPKLKAELFLPYANIEANELRFVARVFDSDPTLNRNELITTITQDLHTLLANEPINITINGTMVLYNNLLQSLLSSQIHSLGFVLGGIFFVFLLIFRSLQSSVIALATTIVPLAFVFGMLGFFKIPLDLMGITIAAISIGIGIDDAIHYIHRLQEEQKTNPIHQAITNAHTSIGTAMYYTTLSIIAGFGIMLSSNFIPTIYFGLLTSLIMLLMLLSSLILLPALFCITPNKPRFLNQSHQDSYPTAKKSNRL